MYEIGPFFKLKIDQFDECFLNIYQITIILER